MNSHPPKRPSPARPDRQATGPDQADPSSTAPSSTDPSSTDPSSTADGGAWRVRPIEWCSAEYQASLELRHRILRAPLNLKFAAEELDAEMEDLHFGGFLDEHLIAVISARRLDEQSSQLRQMAVDPQHERQGYGGRLLAEVESRLMQQGIETFRLHARATVVPFYAQSGYVPVGQPFEEVTLPHQEMIKKAPSTGAVEKS